MKKLRLLSIITASVMALSMTACGTNAKTDTSEAAESGGAMEDTQTEAGGEENTLSGVVNLSKIVVDGNTFKVDGSELWINGVNTPWDKWNDFGGGFNEEFWDEHFGQLHEAGVNASRVWINCNGNTSIKIEEETGNVTKVTGKHWEDLDKLFDIAQKHEVYLMPTLLSFDHFKDSNSGYKGWRAMIQSEEATKTFTDMYVVPFVERYGDNTALFGIDLMNEPDWVVENSECGKIGWDSLSPFFARCTAAIHETNPDVLVTVGAGMVKYNSDKFEGNYLSDEFLAGFAGEKAALDFWSTHYYYWQNSYMGFPFETTPAEFGLGTEKPCVIGETAAKDESGRDLTARYESAYNNGWNGVMAWTSNGVDKCGGYDDVKPATTRILELAPEKVFPKN